MPDAAKQQPKPSLTLKRHLRAPVGRVFKAWTEGEALKRWFGPTDDFVVSIADVDLKVGGRYRIVMKGGDGQMHHVGGVYREIEPNQRLVFTWAWESTPERESLVTVSFKAVNGGTDLMLLHEQFFDEAARDLHEHGWSGSLERLLRHLG